MYIPSILIPHEQDCLFITSVINKLVKIKLLKTETFGPTSGLSNSWDKAASYALKIFIMAPVLTLCAATDLIFWSLKTITIIWIYDPGVKEHFSQLISILALPILGFSMALLGKSLNHLIQGAEVETEEQGTVEHFTHLANEAEINEIESLLDAGFDPDNFFKSGACSHLMESFRERTTEIFSNFAHNIPDHVIEHQDREVAHFCIRHSAEIDLTSTGDSFSTPFAHALVTSNYETAAILSSIQNETADLCIEDFEKMIEFTKKFRSDFLLKRKAKATSLIYQLQVPYQKSELDKIFQSLTIDFSDIENSMKQIAGEEYLDNIYFKAILKSGLLKHLQYPFYWNEKANRVLPGLAIRTFLIIKDFDLQRFVPRLGKELQEFREKAKAAS